MRYLILLFAFLLSFPEAKAQQAQDPPVPPPSASLNKVDGKGKRHGTWLTSREPRMGESGLNEFGHYEHGHRTGPWYKIDHDGDLVAIESFRNDVLDGEVKYYDRGRLYCIGHYRGLNPQNKYDTIVVTHPITQEEHYRVIPTDNGSLRHGTWQYFNPDNGHLIKEEEYQVDELISRKEYETSSALDSVYRRKHEALMPHNRPLKASVPPGKRISYTED